MSIPDKPFPIKLGEMKPILQQEAVEHDRSLHYWIKKILADYLKKKKPKKIKKYQPPA